MPLVRMLVSIAGTGTTPTWDEGDEVQMTPEQAAVWADGVRGELVREVRTETTAEGTRRHRGRSLETTSRR